MSGRIRCGIIGCGNIYGMHRDVLKTLPQVRVTAVADTKPERAQAAAQECGCAAYTDYRQLLKRDDVDAVHICTPHYLHAQMAVDALNAGKYVLCEKPMAVTVDDAGRMLAADDAAGGNRLCIVFQNRYNDSSQALKSMVQEQPYGPLKALRGMVTWKRTAEYYSDDWHGTRAYEGGGVMINQAIHTLDLVQWLGGGAVSIAGAVTTDRIGGIQVEDTAHAFIRMQNGVTAVFYATNAYETDAPVEVEAMFERATVLLRADSLYLWQQDRLVPLVDGNAAAAEHKDYWGKGHRRQIVDFYDCITEKKPFAVDGRQGIEAVKLVQGLYAAGQTGKETNL
ncbi:MAG: Gfo/Idh/MocA family oxidoreductase [Eubacteriales bacterium]|nr:Gfo/Idh/MocA family oxidoreductase [Eubacteriales bacterium]